jgi:PAS domain S-box-containing protein
LKISDILRPLKEMIPANEPVKMPEDIPSILTEASVIGKTRSNGEKGEEVISKLRLTNKLLSYNISKFETVIDNLNDGIIILDSSSRILAINHIMEQLLGLKRGEVKGKHISECVCSNEIFNFILENYESIDKLVEKTADINVTSSNLRVSYKTLIRDDGNACGSLLIAKDITSQKLAEQAKVEFLSHVSHELKSPINTIKGYTEMIIKGEVKNKETLMEFANTVNEEADRLASLINNLLNLTKIERGSLALSKSMTRSKEFIENVFKIATYQKKKLMNYELIIPEKLPPINIDKEFMGTVLINLIGNATKYTPEKGRVTVKVEETGDKIMIHIIDTGIGISEEDISHIFEKFYRSTDEKVRKQTGHGLGLSIAKQIVELHDGEIMVISKRGEGSQFTVVLPIEEGYFLE